jgi:CHASE2 domain-containing sensor protein
MRVEYGGSLILMNEKYNTAIVILVMFYNFFLFVGVAYFVALHDWSPFMFIFAYLIQVDYKTEDDNET